MVRSRTRQSIRRLAAACVALSAPLFGAPTQAADQTRTMRIVVPYGPGGSSDILARLFGEAFARRSATPVIIENRPGGAGLVGLSAVVRSEPNGQTLYWGPDSLATTAIFVRNPSVDVFKEVAPITELVDSQLVLLIPEGLPARSVSELVAYAKSNAGKLNYGSPGRGLTTLYFEMLKQRASLDMVEILYKSGADTLQGLLTGQTHMMFAAINQAISTREAKKARPLGVSGRLRAPELPDVPTLSEAGLEGVDSYGFGLFAPSGTPVQSVDAIQREFGEILKEPAIRARLTAISFRPVGSTPAEFTRKMRTNFELMSRVAKTANIQPME
jgi:tripartite-type tricarboxylate transporter receptor subunit TctC